MKTYPLLKLLSAILLPIAAQAQLELSIPQVLNRVEEHSRSIKIQQVKTEIAEHQIKDARNERLPDINVNLSVDKASNFLIYESGLFQPPAKHDVIHTLYSTNTNMYLNLYDGLRVKNTIALRELQLDLQKENLLQNRAAQKLQAVLLFLDLYLQKEWEKLIVIDVQEKEHQLKEINDFYELGTVLQSDVLRAELELSKRRMTLVEIRNQQKKINQQLNMLIGLSDEEVVVPQLSNALPNRFTDFKQALTTASTNAYAEKISNLQVSIIEKQLQIVKSASAIKVGLGGSFQFSNPQIFLYPYNSSWYTLGMIGLKAAIPLGQIYKNKQKEMAAKLAIEEIHEHHKKTQDDIRTTIYQDYLSLDESFQHINTYQLNTKYALENARIIKDAYFNQTALITDLLDANILVLKSKFELQQSLINVYKNYYKLQFSKGTL